ncbi:hypothetical protein AB4Y45_08290 [Paraburkholderia sp. EG287A]|uniref:hypothetical protein n=1 Tax=unclassified Paraburkholderia TaxID=2615204 RepID=UPI0034D36B75
MDRRAFLCDAGAVVLGAAWQAHPLSVAIGERAPRAGAAFARSVAVYDPALAQGRVLARAAARAGCVAWAIGDGCADTAASDIGTLWHARIAQRLEPGAALTGALRPSDRFVLARLASARGVTLRDFA